jgi:hypothetical protein
MRFTHVLERTNGIAHREEDMLGFPTDPRSPRTVEDQGCSAVCKLRRCLLAFARFFNSRIRTRYSSKRDKQHSLERVIPSSFQLVVAGGSYVLSFARKPTRNPTGPHTSCSNKRTTFSFLNQTGQIKCRSKAYHTHIVTTYQASKRGS